MSRSPLGLRRRLGIGFTTALGIVACVSDGHGQSAAPNPVPDPRAITVFDEECIAREAELILRALAGGAELRGRSRQLLEGQSGPTGGTFTYDTQQSASTQFPPMGAANERAMLAASGERPRCPAGFVFRHEARIFNSSNRQEQLTCVPSFLFEVTYAEGALALARILPTSRAQCARTVSAAEALVAHLAAARASLESLVLSQRARGEPEAAPPQAERAQPLE